MSTYVTPRMRDHDTAGAPLAGAKLNFYTTGTSNRLDTFDEPTLTGGNENANPVVADANGIFGPIFLSDTVAYKVVFTDSDDTEIWTEDPVWGVSRTGSDLSARMAQVISSPLDQGAIGDGVADESTEVQAAIDAAVREVNLLGKTFRCDSAITIPTDISVVDGNLDFTNCTDPEYIKIQGTIGSYTNLTANEAFQSDFLAATSVSGLAAGDIINLISSGTYADDGVQGELAEIRNISTLDVYLASSTLDGYTTANTGRLAKVTTVDNVILRNLVITANSAVATANTRIIAAHNTKGLRLDNVKISGVKNFAILLAGCLDTIIEGCEWTNGATGTSIGVLVEEATQDLTIRDCKSRRMWKGVDTETTLGLGSVAVGVRRRINIHDNTFELSESGWGKACIIGQDSQHVRIADNYITGGAAGPQLDIACVDIFIDRNEIDSSAGTGIDIDAKVPNNTGRGYQLSVVGNTCRGTAADIAYNSAAIAAGSGVLDELKIAGNHIDQGQITLAANATGGDVLSVLITHNVVRNMAINGSNVTVSDCLIESNKVGGAVATLIAIADINRANIVNNIIRGDGVTAAFGISATQVAGNTELNISGNSVSNFITTGIKTTDSAYTTIVNVTDNQITDTGSATTAGISLAQIPRGNISGNVISSYGDGLILTNSASPFDGVTISNNQIEAGTGAGSGNGIEVTASSGTSIGLTVTGNNVTLINSGAGKYCLDVNASLAGFSVVGNVLTRDNDTDDNIRLAGNATISSGIVQGNVLSNGEFGIIITGSSTGTISVGGNTYVGMNSGNVSGDGYGLVAEADATSPAKSALRLVPQDALPTSPVQGDSSVLTVDGRKYTYNGSVWRPATSVVFVGTNAADTIGAGATGAFVEFAQKYSIPAGALVAGSMVKIVATFRITTSGTGTFDYDLIFDDQGGALAIVGQNALAVAANPQIAIEAWMVVKSTGSPGVVATGGITTDNAAAFTRGNSAEQAIDTPAVVDLALQLKWTNNDNVAELDCFTVEIL